MARSKYQQYFKQMMEENRELFEEFRPIHAKYKQDKQKYQQEFNDKGQELVDIIRSWERRLCSAMGRTRYGKYAEQLSEKFWDLVREEFDCIDMVGLKIEKD